MLWLIAAFVYIIGCPIAALIYGYTGGETTAGDYEILTVFTWPFLVILIIIVAPIYYIGGGMFFVLKACYNFGKRKAEK